MFLIISGAIFAAAAVKAYSGGKHNWAAFFTAIAVFNLGSGIVTA